MEQNVVEASPAVITMTIGITRKATGLTEFYDLVCTPVEDEEVTEETKES
jgi:hypothetical protein